jgi:hypothetical protein
MRLSSSEPPIAELLEAAEVVWSAEVVGIVESAAEVVEIVESAAGVVEIVELVAGVVVVTGVTGVAGLVGVAEASRPISFGVSF